MKRILVALASLLLLARFSAFGQGTVFFDNTRQATGSLTGVPFFDENGVRLEGTNYMVQMYAGPTADSLAPVAVPAFFETANGAGYFRGGAVSIISVAPCVVVWVQFRAWEAVGGTTFEAATAAGRWTGLCNVLLVQTGGCGLPPTLPGMLTGLRFLGTGRLPLITLQPTNQTAQPGDNVTFSVGATNGPLSYQWQFGGWPMPDQTNSSLNLVSVNTSQAGQYDVVISNPMGAEVSEVATLVVTGPTGSPVIVSQPHDQAVAPGVGVTLSVNATGSPSLFYQWYRGKSGDTNQPIVGATNAILALPPVINDGTFWVNVRSPVGSVNSDNAVVAVTPPLDDWTWRNPLPQGNALYDLTYGRGLFVAVGGWGTILTSPDRVAWTRRTAGTFHDVVAITYGNGIFVAVGDAGDIVTSSDGITWTQRASGMEVRFSSVAYGNGTFVTVGDAGAILTSADGIRWNSRSSGQFYALSRVVYGGGLFVAVGGAVLTSPDGIIWTIRTPGMQYPLSGASYANGVFFALGNPTLTSSDGITWNRPTSAALDGVSAVTYASGIFVSVGQRGVVFNSADGITWTNHASGASSWLSAVTYANGTFVCVGDGGAIFTSDGGIAWTSRTSLKADGLYNITSANGTFVAVGWRSGAKAPILTSSDGVNWTSRDSGTSTGLGGVTYGEGVFVAVGDQVLTSSDGVIWTQRASLAGNWLNSVTFGNGMFVAVGNNPGYTAGVIYTSFDGLNWTNRTSGSATASPYLLSVTYGNGLFAGGGGWGTLSTSVDGITWTNRTTATHATLSGIAYGNGTFVVVGYRWGAILTSTDGITWVDRTPTPAPQLGGVTYGDGVFVAVGGATIMSSYDGVAWSSRTALTGNGFAMAAYGNGTFVVVGGSSIVQSAHLGLEPFQLRTPALAPGGAFACTLDAPAGSGYTFQASSNLLDWVDLINVTISATNNLITDTNAKVGVSRFYRAVLRY
ncbi:MAG: immunoglobulin domain-containing protein [Limisphaerales bacterium]